MQPIYAPYHPATRQFDITDWMVPDPDDFDDDIVAIVRAMQALAEHEESER